MEKCDRCGKECKTPFGLSVHKRYCKYPVKPQVSNDQIESLNRTIEILQRRLEAVDADKDLNASIGTEAPNEQKSGMYIIDKAPKEITGDATEAILKSRFKDYEDAARSIEKFVQRYYSTLENTRYGGDSVLIPVDELESGQWNMDDLKKFSSWDEIEIIKDREYIRIFVEMASIRETLSQVARIGSSDGKARLEDIHKAGAKAEGQAYVEAHTPPPDIYAKQYKEGSKKLEAAADATLGVPTNDA